jgi:hypothetical protein
VLDAVNLERKGIPAAVVGLDKLVNTTGKGMAQAQGYSAMHFAVIPYSVTDWGGAATDDELIAKAQAAAQQVERILTESSP